MERRSALSAQILLHPVEVLDRDEEAVAFGVLELQVLPVRAVRLDEAHALEARDAVIDMNHELVGREVKREFARQVGGARPGAAA